MNDQQIINGDAEEISNEIKETESTDSMESVETSVIDTDKIDEPIDGTTSEDTDLPLDEDASSIPPDLGASMMSNFGDVLGKLGGGPDYSGILKSIVDSIEQIGKNVEYVNDTCEKFKLQIKALTLFVKMSMGISIVSILALIIHIIFW